MYTPKRVTRLVAVVALVHIGSRTAMVSGQALTPAAASDQQDQSAVVSEHEHGGDIQMAREGSGTSWLPDASPMYAVHSQLGAWQLMVHDNAFLQFLHESGARGADQAGSINWIMGMAQRSAGRGRV